MKWKHLLATLALQTKLLTVEDFLSLKEKKDLLHFPDKLAFNLKEGLLRKFILENKNWIHTGEKALNWITKNHGHVLVYGDTDYPKKFYNLHNPPIFLSYFGSPCWRKGMCISIVGSRKPSFKSLKWMEYCLPEILQRGIITVSGAARGIDQKAHAISLSMELPTIAFLPSGLGAIYPQDFVRWVQQILKSGGAVISEYAPLQEMRKHHFLERNRMIASLGECLLVVEAKRRSGTSMTARLAVDMNQNVCVLPAFPSDMNYQGNLDLIYDGASPIRDARDLELILKLIGNLNSPQLTK